MLARERQNNAIQGNNDVCLYGYLMQPLTLLFHDSCTAKDESMTLAARLQKSRDLTGGKEVGEMSRRTVINGECS